MNLPMLNNVEAVVASRNAALEIFETAVQIQQAAYAKLREARDMMARAHFNVPAVSMPDNLRNDENLSALDAVEKFRKANDIRIWTYMLDRSGLRNVMDAQAIKEFEQSIITYMPEVTLDSLRATFEDKFASADYMFKRGIHNAFGSLDRSFKSHNGFKIGRRIILTYVANDSGYIDRYQNSKMNTLIDVERVFAVLDGQIPMGDKLVAEIRNGRSNHWKPHQSEHDLRYFKIRIFQNGNAHLWFTRDDLVEKVNKLLADLYGEVLPDGRTAEDAVKETKGTAVSKDLQFYATPVDIASKEIESAGLGRVKEGSRILEPSAGEGALIDAFVIANQSTKFIIDAVEVDENRAKQLMGCGLNSVYNRNFFSIEPNPVYDVVLMNPPFYGTHYMDHVYHAFKFLKPGGVLWAILPITAELGESAAHTKFRKFVETHKARYTRQYVDLPFGSFSASGTNVNTCWIKLQNG